MAVVNELIEAFNVEEDFITANFFAWKSHEFSKSTNNKSVSLSSLKSAFKTYVANGISMKPSKQSKQAKIELNNMSFRFRHDPSPFSSPTKLQTSAKLALSENNGD